MSSYVNSLQIYPLTHSRHWPLFEKNPVLETPIICYNDFNYWLIHTLLSPILSPFSPVLFWINILPRCTPTKKRESHFLSMVFTVEVWLNDLLGSRWSLNLECFLERVGICIHGSWQACLAEQSCSANPSSGVVLSRVWVWIPVMTPVPLLHKKLGRWCSLLYQRGSWWMITILCLHPCGLWRR